MPDLLALVDRALTRARRHAAILAGHNLDADLARLSHLSASRLRGVTGVHLAWSNRLQRERGTALPIDTDKETRHTHPDLDTTLDPIPVRVPDDAASRAALAHATLTRCLAIALTAAVHTGRYRWHGCFSCHDAISRAGWDLLAHEIR